MGPLSSGFGRMKHPTGAASRANRRCLVYFDVCEGGKEPPITAIIARLFQSTSLRSMEFRKEGGRVSLTVGQRTPQSIGWKHKMQLLVAMT
jgi:hypothetical protein